MAKRQIHDAYIFLLVVSMDCRSSSSVSSTRVEFWIRDRFCSVSSVTRSRSCWGSVKYSSGSSCRHRKEGNIQTTVNTANKTCTVASVNLRFSVQKRKTDLIFWVTVQFRTYDPEMPKSLGWGQRFWRSMCKICCFYALLWGSYKYRICNIL